MTVPFTILLTTYNRSHTIMRALESVLAQTFPMWELIILDDGSDDDTFSLLHPTLLDDSRIRYHFSANRGLPMMRDLGVEMAEGDYITFLDSDDAYLPNHLETRLAILEEDPEIELLHGGLEVIGDPLVPDRHNPQKKIPITECAVGGTFFFTIDLFDELAGFNMMFGDDADFLERATALGAKIVRTDIPTYQYYRDQYNSLCNQ